MVRGWSSNVLTGDVDAARRAPGPRLLACQVPPLGAHGASLWAGWLVPEQERQQHKAPPRGHLEDLVQVRAAEQQRSTGSRPVQLRPVLGEAQLTALIAIIEIQSKGPCRGRRAGVKTGPYHPKSVCFPVRVSPNRRCAV